MTRSQIDELSQNLIFLINEMEDVLMKKIAAQLVSDGDVSDSSKWRIRQLARAGKLDKEALKTIKSYMSAQSEMLEDALYNAAVSEIGNVDEMVKDAATRGLVDGRVKAPADRTAQSALKSYLKQAKSDLNMVNTVMRYKTKQAYVSAVNNTFWTLDKEQRVHDALGMGALEVISGAESFQTAVRDVLKKLSEKGIPAFIDAGGHEWKPETYVQMDLRTTMGNTARAAQWQRCDDFGVDLIEVDSHLGAREKCARDQGKIYSRSGKSGTCKDGSGNVVYYYAFSSTSFGQPDGLFGINCRHNSYPYIPGVSYQRYFPVDEAENAKRYKEYQTQRALERKIRESKRECMLLSEAGDEEGLKKAALTLRNRKENYRAYSKAHDLRVHNDRTQVYGYDRSKSMKTVWAEKKAQSGGSSAPAPSGGKAVTVNAPAPASSGKAYTGEKITKPLDKPLENKVKAVEMPQAKNIEEAQAYAKKLGVEYPDYSKFTVERANNMNKALSTLPDDSAPYVVTDLQKYTAVTGAPLDKRAKNGYACTVTPYEIDLKRAKIADTPRISGSGDTVVAVNTKTYKTLDSITESKARSEELIVSRNLGKAYHFNTEGKATDFHECGHIYASKHGLPMAFSADADRWYRETGCELLKSPSEAWAEAYAAYYTHADDLPSYIRRYFDNGEWKTNSGSKVLTLDEWYKKLLDNGGGSGIIKSIDVDDFTMMASCHEIAPEVSNLIANTIREYEKKGGMYISDMHFGNFIDEDTGKPALMQIFQNYYGLTEININSAIMAGKTLDEIDSIIAAAKSNLPQNLREAVIHECGHAKAYYGKTPEEVMAINEHIKDRGVDGISRIAKNDGAECIAEVEVLLSRGEPISEKAMELYNAYVKGGKRK